MASKSSRSGDAREALLRHLERLYVLAQIVTTDAEEAVHLVQATYAHALATAPSSWPDRNLKRWLFQLMMDLHHETTPATDDETHTPAAFGDDETTPSAKDPRPSFQRQLAERILDRVLPVVLANRSEEMRVPLLLCDVEQLSIEAASEVLSLDPEDTREQLERARHSAWSDVRANVSPAERHLLDTALSDDALSAALRRVVQAEFTPVPPTLRPSVLAATEPASPAPDPQETSAPSPRHPDTTSTQASSSFGKRLGRFALTLSLIVVVGLLGYAGSRLLDREPETNLITLSAQTVDDLAPTVRTDRPEQAERFVEDQLGWRLILPGIDGAALIGASILEIAPGTEVPVFFYDDIADQSITLYVYNYNVLLDRAADRLQLAPDVLRQIEDDKHFDLHAGRNLGDRQVVVWRNRDDIFVAVTDGDAEALRKRIIIPS